MILQLIKLAENGFLPDFLVRYGIYLTCKSRLEKESGYSIEDLEAKKQDWIAQMQNSDIALVPDKANEQHYEVPAEFFDIVLGPQLKYSSGYWERDTLGLEDSENNMLSISVERAEIEDGMKILDIGCGWGSLSFYMAQRYPNSQITSVSNSKDQREFIKSKCDRIGIENINAMTADMNEFKPENRFDRVVSIEMFEHMRNYWKLLFRISSWLKDDGKLFIHIFSHKSFVYPFENERESDWMAREFFSGGMMPSHDLLLNFQKDLNIEKTWRISGQHYEKTSLCWLKNMDSNKSKIIKIFSDTYGVKKSKLWFQRWRIFFMSCEKLFGFNNGQEWGISHYRFIKK
tara:strand:+ start:1003 stop:2037 length:1035 start_codon:yes stop_codon:yes gene_type:complete